MRKETVDVLMGGYLSKDAARRGLRGRPGVRRAAPRRWSSSARTWTAR